MMAGNAGAGVFGIKHRVGDQLRDVVVLKVVDLWGGFRNRITKAPCQEDTLVNMFSTTKGVS